LIDDLFSCLFFFGFLKGLMGIFILQFLKKGEAYFFFVFERNKGVIKQ